MLTRLKFTARVRYDVAQWQAHCCVRLFKQPDTEHRDQHLKLGSWAQIRWSPHFSAAW